MDTQTLFIKAFPKLMIIIQSRHQSIGGQLKHSYKPNFRNNGRIHDKLNTNTTRSNTHRPSRHYNIQWKKRYKLCINAYFMSITIYGY